MIRFGSEADSLIFLSRPCVTIVVVCWIFSQFIWKVLLIFYLFGIILSKKKKKKKMEKEKEENRYTWLWIYLDALVFFSFLFFIAWKHYQSTISLSIHYRYCDDNVSGMQRDKTSCMHFTLHGSRFRRRTSRYVHLLWINRTKVWCRRVDRTSTKCQCTLREVCDDAAALPVFASRHSFCEHEIAKRYDDSSHVRRLINGYYQRSSNALCIRHRTADV